MELCHVVDLKDEDENDDEEGTNNKNGATPFPYPGSRVLV